MLWIWNTYRYEQGNINIYVVEKGKNIFEINKCDNMQYYQLKTQKSTTDDDDLHYTIN